MNKFLFGLSLFFTAAGYSQAGAPAMPYYSGFNFNQTGSALRTALAYKVIDTHENILTYQQAENAIKIVDLDPEDPTNTNVLLVYGFSPGLCPSAQSSDNDHRRRNKNYDGGGANCEWNREHTYPKSLGNPDLGETGPGADAHHLRASDVERNGDRGSQKFADGSGNSGDVTSSTWYPGDEWKGDIARMMMYMYLRYGNRCLPKNVGTGPTVASDPNMLMLFLEWNAEDPVSQVEDQRNAYLGNGNNTYGQGNRNPFIDNPYLATLIWGGPAAQNRWPTLSVTVNEFDAALALYPNPATHTAYVSSPVAIDNIEVYDLNGRSVLSMTSPMAQDGKIALNLPSGFYIVRMASGANSAVRKLIVQ